MNFPNLITLIRIFLVPLFFIALVSYQPGREKYRVIALALFVLASVTDALDGFLARVTHSRTELGRFLDPLADKFLLLSGYLGLFFVPALVYRPPLWITVTIVFRDFVIVTGLIVLFLLTGRIRVQPNLLGKFTTGFQMATFVLILLDLKIAVPFWDATALLTIASCIVYVVRDMGKLKHP